MVKKTITTSIILACFGLIPGKIRKFLFTTLSRLFYHLSPRQRLIALHNLKNAYPEKSIPDLIRIAKNVYRNIGIVAAEFFEIPSLNKQNLTHILEVEGLENYTKAMKKNKGLLVFGAHFGNWELEAIATSFILQPAIIIYRRLDNPILENLVTWVRSSTGNSQLPKERATRTILRSLQKKMAVGMLIDQNVSWQEGVFVDFFGRPACTTDGFALLAISTGAPVISVFLARMPTGRYRLIIGKEVEIIRTGDHDLDIIKNTQNFTGIIEAMVRQYPDQWFWVHQRWKTKISQVDN